MSFYLLPGTFILQLRDGLLIVPEFPPLRSFGIYGLPMSDKVCDLCCSKVEVVPILIGFGILHMCAECACQEGYVEILEEIEHELESTNED